MSTLEFSGVREMDHVGDVVAAAERLWQAGSHMSPADALVQIRHACNVLELAFSRTAAEFAESDVWEEYGYVSEYSWLRDNCKMTSHAAVAAVNIGKHMQDLPRSYEALEEGAIGFSHLAMLAGTINNISVNNPTFPVDEDVLLRKAKKHTLMQFRRDCDYYRHAADAESFLKEHVNAVEGRRLEVNASEGGCFYLRGVFDPEGGATVLTALEALARPTDALDHRLRDKRLADALVELANHGLDAGIAPSQHSVRPHVQLTVSLETLERLKGSPAADLEYAATPVPAVTAQRLTCDATVRRIVCDAESAVLDAGRGQRIASAPLRSALAVRDKGCAWPRCDRPHSWTAAHHIEHWAQGGATHLGNLLSLCHRHHQMVHEDGWTLSRTTDGLLKATPPVLPYIWDVWRGIDIEAVLPQGATLDVVPSYDLTQQARAPDLVPD